jgi:RNA polymerase sigma factor (sigma-70 family)
MTPAAGAAATGTVLVVEDDILLQRALGRLFRTAGYRVELFDSVPAFLRHPAAPGPACLVLDLHLPDGNGFEILERLEAEGRALPAVVVTAHGDVPTTVRAMKSGAIELLEKPFDNRALLAAVAAGIARAEATGVERAGRRDAAARLATLTPREREVLELVVEGLPNKRIASRLGVAEKTVKVHRARLMEKCGALSLPDLVRLAARAGGEPRGELRGEPRGELR